MDGASWLEHQARLRSALCEGALLVDCHSFPQDLSEVEVCIGVNTEWSRQDDSLIDSILRHFTSRGYFTRLNTPYSNAVAPECGFRYRSLMIEVNKATYLEAENQLNRSKALILRETIEEYLLLLLGVIP